MNKRLSVLIFVLVFICLGGAMAQAGWNDVNCVGNWAFDYENIDDNGDYNYEMVAQAPGEYNIIYYWNADKINLSNFAVDIMDERFDKDEFNKTTGQVYIVVATDYKRTIIQMPANYFPEANIIEGNDLVHVTNMPESVYWSTGGPPIR